ncbi:hypothetical protein [Methylotenera sp. N17]|uniref:hypothetical protein n=1 Tax=Methylotenera sp. N17 TaxID=1502761 RepID=UPI000646F9B8|nr:hypothetical protein [Methylotenera sp. N17]
MSSISAISNNLGWPQHKRVEELTKLNVDTPRAHFRVFFKGQNLDLPIIRVPISLPKYRLANGRTSSLQAEYLAKNSTQTRDLFTGDPELLDAQLAQHELLLMVMMEQGLRKKFDDPSNKQVEPILLDERGFVVNGNRRLSCWRDLYNSDVSKYGHFGYIDVAVLPHSDEKDIDRLEAWLQIQKDIKADYSWDARANMLLDKQKREDFSNKELSDLYGLKENEITELIDMRDYGDTYLRSRGKTDMWSLVSDHEEAFRKIVFSRPKIQDLGSQAIFMEASFVLIDNPAKAGGRLYEQIPAILDCLDQVKEKLVEEFPVADSQSSAQIQDLFGGGGNNSASNFLPLSLEIRKPENIGKARDIIVEVITSAKELKKNSKAAEYLLECCKKANAQLSAAVQDGLRPESNLKGVSKQLEIIESSIDTIRRYLTEHVKD